MERLDLEGGDSLAADVYVFACGPWLGQLFPEVVGARVRATRQEVFFFGTPAGDRRFREDGLPVWIDFGERVYYGIPGNEERGFKLADDTRGDLLDPTTAERTVTPEILDQARAALARRFPALAGAPVVETRVCQYENTPDGHFLVDRHPHAGNVWIVGGGSGHGFKLAPVLGEHAADLALGRAEPLAAFSLARLAEEPAEPPKSQFSTGIPGAEE
jgi:glycine/D-amino acid oxidase-like deaminating enzyme